MKFWTYRLLYHGAALAIAACLFIVAMIFLSAEFNINILDKLVLLFNEPTEYGEWEFVEEINGVEHVYSSANGDNPKAVLSPFSYWLGFRGGTSLILALIAALFAYLIGHAIVRCILRIMGRTRTVITEAKNHTLADHVSDSVNEYVDRCKEEFETNRINPDRSVYLFGKKFVKGDRKSTIRLIVFIVLVIAVVGYFVLCYVLGNAQ